MQVGAFQGVDGHDLRVGERRGGIGAGRDRAQVVGGDVVDEERDDAGGHRRVAFLAQNDPQLVQVGSRQGRVFLGQVEAAVGRQALQQNVAEGAGGRIGATSSRNITHGQILSERKPVKPDRSYFVTFSRGMGGVGGVRAARERVIETTRDEHGSSLEPSGPYRRIATVPVKHFHP